METISTVMLGLGILLMILNFLLGIVELATLRTIRPPERKSFAHIRLTQTQYQTVFAPALGALISGLFVSMSASFLYASFSSERHEWDQPIGLTLFIAGAVALAVTLRSVLREVGEPSALARDPFTIRAAAEEFAADPRRGTLEPSFLTEQLNKWFEFIDARSMNLSLKATSDGLTQRLMNAAQRSGFWASIPHSLLVYRAALEKFPIRFGWPIFSLTLFIIGTLLFSVGYSGLQFTSSFRPWFVVAFFLFLGGTSTLFYCVTRGNRARLWHRINLVAFEDAQKAIDVAKVAQISVAEEEALLKQVLNRADSFFRQGRSAPETDARVIFRLGRAQVSVVRD